MQKTHVFNHRLLDHLNTDHKTYMPALNWELHRVQKEEHGDHWFEWLHNPEELKFSYTIDYTAGTTTIRIYRQGKVVRENTKSLPCHQGGPTVVASVMGTAKRIDDERPVEARQAAAAYTVLALEGICIGWLRNEADKIGRREYDNPVHSDRYQRCYEEDV